MISARLPATPHELANALAELVLDVRMVDLGFARADLEAPAELGELERDLVAVLDFVFDDATVVEVPHEQIH